MSLTFMMSLRRNNNCVLLPFPTNTLRHPLQQNVPSNTKFKYPQHFCPTDHNAWGLPCVFWYVSTDPDCSWNAVHSSHNCTWNLVLSYVWYDAVLIHSQSENTCHSLCIFSPSPHVCIYVVRDLTGCWIPFHIFHTAMVCGVFCSGHLAYA